MVIRLLRLLDGVVDLVLRFVDRPHDFLRRMGMVVVLRRFRFLLERGHDTWWHDGFDRVYYYLHISVAVVSSRRTLLVVPWLWRNPIAVVPPIATRLAVKQNSIKGF